MFWSVVALVFSVLLDFFNLRSLSDREKDLEILLLRHQLDILERKQPHPIKPSKAEKLTLSVLTNKLKTISKRPASQLRNVLRIFQPETVLKWHRELALDQLNTFTGGKTCRYLGIYLHTIICSLSQTTPN